MKQQHYCRTPGLLPLAPWLAWLVHRASRAACARAERRLRNRAYHDLNELDEHTLRDLGLSHRAAAERPRET